MNGELRRVEFPFSSNLKMRNLSALPPAEEEKMSSLPPVWLINCATSKYVEGESLGVFLEKPTRFPSLFPV